MVAWIMVNATPITGVILAGGLARRMQQQDKGLVHFKQQAMIQYAIDALSPVVECLLINANRNINAYQRFNYPVIQDDNNEFAGPLAGIYAALCHCQHEQLIVIPCDSPFIRSDSLRHFIKQHQQSSADISVASDGERLHPVFLVLNTTLKTSLKAYLDSGERKIDSWFQQHHYQAVDFSDSPELFTNINTLEQLETLSHD